MSRKSCGLPIVLPIRLICLPNILRTSISTCGPLVFPTITIRPPLATTAMLVLRVAAPTLSTTRSTPRFAVSLLDLLAPVAPRTVDHEISSQFAGFFRFFGVARHHIDGGPGQFGDLYGCAVDASSGPDYQHCLAGPEFSPVYQHPPGRKGDQQRGAGFGEIDIVRHSYQVFRGRRHILREPSANMLANNHIPGAHGVLAPAREFIFDRIYSMIDHNPLAGFKSGNALAQTGHNSGYVRSAPVRHLKIKARPSSHDPYIEVIQSAGFDFDKDLASTGSGIGNIVVPENIETAMLVKTKSFHFL